MRSLLLASLFASAFALSCSSSEGGPDPGACVDYTPPASFDAQNPKVSFKTDVMPILKQSCQFSSCHGNAGNKNFVYLGGTDTAAIIAGIVNVKATAAPGMSYVTPNDPRASFLMRKMDGSQCAMNAECKAKDCGASMPKDSTPLPIDTRDKVRRWIAQGAQDN